MDERVKHAGADTEFCVLCLSGEHERVDDEPCAAMLREEPMPDTVYCGERGYHQRHSGWQGGSYYAWLDGDEGAGYDR